MTKSAAGQQPSLADLIEQPYVVLFEKAPDLSFSEQQIKAFREHLEKEKERERNTLRDKEDAIEKQIEQAQDELDELNKSSDETPEQEAHRHDLHCRIQQLRKEKREAKLALENGLDNTYDNKFAKLKILEEWPQTYAQIRQLIETNQVYQQKFGDYRDIGFRDADGTFEGQEEDVKDGREAIEELKRQGLLPPEVEDQQVVQYTQLLAGRIARHSDLRVPVKVAVLKSEEINAFALPGGFLFINSGLILKAGSESELAGVIAHEIAHAAARHGHRLITRANIASIIFQAAQIAALIFTGGVASIGAYYALQYGFYGLGLVLNLALLGVSRDYETEADILGTQYLWHAGYDPKGFISFFDEMAREKGYVTGLSWFRTHPPFYRRMAKAYEWVVLLPEEREPVVDTPEFHKVKEKLTNVVEEMKKKDREAPTLKRVYDCDDEKEAPSRQQT